MQEILDEEEQEDAALHGAGGGQSDAPENSAAAGSQGLTQPSEPSSQVLFPYT